MEGPATSGVRLLGEDGNPLTLGLLRRGTTVHLASDGSPVSFGCLGPTAYFGVTELRFFVATGLDIFRSSHADFAVSPQIVGGRRNVCREGEDVNPMTQWLLQGTTVCMASDGSPVSFGCLGPTAYFGVTVLRFGAPL